MASVASATLPYPTGLGVTTGGPQQPLAIPQPVSAADKRVSQASACSGTSTNSDGKRKMQVGPWRLGRTLGRGSSGRVRLAKNVNTGQLAAVKIVPKSVTPTAKKKDDGKGEKTGDTELSYSIEREVVIMKLIEHPNVMSLYDVWENRGELYLVLEYIEGGELFDYLVKKGKLEEAEAAKYFRQIIAGVSYCHRFNICHRDLKPENLLLDKNGNIRIADFGMAVLEPKGRLLETSCGSPHYASPEIVAGKTYHGAPSDIWSCGIILFALLTGYLPFDDENIRNLLLKVKAGHFTMPPQLSSEAKDLIWRMLDVDPNTRMRMQDIFRHPFILKYPPGEGEFDVPDIPAVERPVTSEADIDKEIMKNLMILWKGEPRSTIIGRLLSPDPNVEKTFYCLLMRYRQNRLENYRADCPSPNPGVKKSTSATAKPKKSASRNSLTNKLGVVFPQPSNKLQPKPPAKTQVPYPTGGTVSQKKALLEKQANPQPQKATPYPSVPGKSQAPSKPRTTDKTPKTLPYPTSTIFEKGQSPPKTSTGPVAAVTATLAGKAFPDPTKDTSPKAKGAPLGELSPNKQAITKQFASEIEKAFNRLPSPEKKAKASISAAKREIVQSAYRSTRPLPLVPQRPAPVPLRSPGLVGPRSPPMRNSQFDDMAQQFSMGGSDGSRSPSIAPSMATPQIYQDMFADAPDDNTSASSYDLTKPLRTNSTKRPLNERAAGNTPKEKLPVLPFRSRNQIPMPSRTGPTTPLIIQKEPSRLRIASLITPRAANPLLHAPTLDKRTVSVPTQRPLPLTSPVLVDKDYFADQMPPPPRRRSTFRQGFFRPGSLKDSDFPAMPSTPLVQEAAPHPLQQRMNSMKDPMPVKRKWSARLRPGGESLSRMVIVADLLEENVPPMPVMETKPRRPSRKATWTLPTRKPTLPSLQESRAEEEDYPHFDGTGSTEGPIKQSFLAKIFSIKPLSKVIQTTLPADRLRTELLELLKRWEGMGIGIVQVIEDPRTRVIRAKLQSHNSVGLKAVRFKIEILSIRVHASNAVFSQEKGAGSSFTRVVQQVDAVLCGKGYLVSGSSTEKAIPPLTPRSPGIEV